MTFPVQLLFKLAGKSIFFFWLCIYLVEVFLDVNPSQITVAHTTFSISFFEYLTLFDMIRFFWFGFLILIIGAIIFAFSKYEYLIFVVIAFLLSFKFNFIDSTGLMIFYKSTYACHTIQLSSGYQYVCPLQSLVDGHPNIPLQGDVLAPLSLIIASISWFIFRRYAGFRIAFTEAIIAFSAMILFLEYLLLKFQPVWANKQITDYQQLILKGNFTNYDLLVISLTTLVISVAVRSLLVRKGFPKLRRRITNSSFVEATTKHRIHYRITN